MAGFSRLAPATWIPVTNLSPDFSKLLPNSENPELEHLPNTEALMI